MGSKPAAPTTPYTPRSTSVYALSVNNVFMSSMPPRPIPTAVHPMSTLHETPKSDDPVIGGGVAGAETIDHVLPSHCSITGAAGVDGRGGAYADLLIAPTAVQLVALVHETPVISNEAFVGVGLGVIDQLVPSQCSISVATAAVPLV